MSSWSWCKQAWEQLHDEQADYLEQIAPNRLRGAVFLASAAALYVEMVMVRWHGTCFHAFALFKNVSLLSCFLGLGIGFGLAGQRRVALARFLPLLALQTLLFGVLSCTNLGGRMVNPVGEQLVMGSDNGWGLLQAIEGNLFLAVVFVLNAWMFVPLGHLTGRLMSRLPRPQAYSLNLLGSLAGIAAFFLLSLLWTGPEIWMGLAVLLLAPFLSGGRRLTAVGAACLAVILVALGIIGSGRNLTFYSPYQVIALRLPEPDKGRESPSVGVNHAYYQEIIDCSPAGAASSKHRADAANYYNLPYRLQPTPGDVLVVGAGTGNDVAAALRNGAHSVTAVELDPAILRIGRMMHPERPYQDSRTRAVVNDARTYLRQTEEQFDTIVYGLLDSHTNLGAMTNVRVDSFVYTVEAFREAAARLREGGMIVVSYTLLAPGQGDKLYAMLQQAYPDLPPRAFLAENAHDGGTTFVTGPGLRRLSARIAGAREVTDTYRSGAAKADVATDDWPFFYMKARTYPFSYLLMISVLVAISYWMTRNALGWVNGGGRGLGLFFFLGAGFMLVETKAVTELGLLYGNTWSVVAVVVGSILLMAYLANALVARRGPVRSQRVFVLLLGSLAISWAVARLGQSGIVVPLPRLVMPLVLTLPLFFAGLIFSSEFARCSDGGAALSANIFGAMLGGFLEYNSMYWGYSALYPLGLVLYGLAFWCYIRWPAQQPQQGLPTDSTQEVQTAA
jgi:spermidine synthase